MHPLDLSTISEPITINGQDRIVCVSTITGIDNWGQGDFDLSLGDTFLRNVYAVYVHPFIICYNQDLTLNVRFDFGDTVSGSSTADPYIQLLSEVDPVKANEQVTTIRGRTLSTLPPEIDPTTLVRILQGGGSSTVTGLTPSATDVIPPAATGVNGDESRPGDSKSKGATFVSDSGDSFTIDDGTIKKYGLIVICLLGANVLIGLILIVFGILGCIRRGSSRKAATRAVAPQYTPVKSLDYDEAYAAPSYQKQYS